jgi:hypothetical protein
MILIEVVRVSVILSVLGISNQNETDHFSRQCKGNTKVIIVF